MANWPFGSVIEEVGKTVRQVLPNELEKRKLDLEETEILQRGDLAQIDVNKTEATHANLFVAGWRPFIGWTGGAAMAYSFIVRPLLDQLFSLPMPEIELGDLTMIVLSMLGIGAMRTYEKTRGVATSVNGTVPRPM